MSIDIKINDSITITLDNVPYLVAVRRKDDIFNIIESYTWSFATDDTINEIKHKILFMLSNDPIMLRKKKLKKICEIDQSVVMRTLL